MVLLADSKKTVKCGMASEGGGWATGTRTLHSRGGHAGVQAGPALKVISLGVHPAVRAATRPIVALHHRHAEAVGRQQRARAQAAHAASDHHDIRLVRAVARGARGGGRWLRFPGGGGGAAWRGERAAPERRAACERGRRRPVPMSTSGVAAVSNPCNPSFPQHATPPPCRTRVNSPRYWTPCVRKIGHDQLFWWQYPKSKSRLAVPFECSMHPSHGMGTWHVRILEDTTLPPSEKLHAELDEVYSADYCIAR